ncbi:hypothetical protein [Chryseobacterium taichungense]|uniref:Uncharacterized protein n=1 Tax=Chryseobacterium taichungense TaxID=295069 RepID=A0A1H7ZAM9_9FLAO|nr:hypothetical protein [Chryseobacterium taichungense]SEM55460.1 hypothetical protein SAMN05421856_104151 [Chryseobacterium taichungense]
MRINIVLYIIYGLFLMIETFDFLEMLHTKPADYSPTYSLVNVIFYQMEMFICFLCAFGLIILVSTKQSLKILFYICLILLIFRVGTVYYLYFYETEERWIPFIYKRANDFSILFRRTFVPAQIIVGIITLWYAFKALKNNSNIQNFPDSGDNSAI